MKSTLIALFAVISIPNAANADIRSNCFKQWNTNYRMVEFCIEQQSDSANRLGVTREYSVQPMLTGGAHSGSKSHDYVRSGGGCITANNVTHCF